MSFRAVFVLLMPRLLEVVGAAILLRFPPDRLKRSLIASALALALFGLLWTIMAVRPVHVALGELGNTTELIARLSFVDAVRLVPESIRAVVYVWIMWILVRAKREPRGER